MSLLREIQAAAINNTVSLETLLRKCRVLASRLKHDGLKLWVNHELDGYFDSTELPDYRKMNGHCFGHFSGAFGSGMRNAPIPESCIPLELRSRLTHAINWLNDLDEAIFRDEVLEHLFKKMAKQGLVSWFKNIHGRNDKGVDFLVKQETDFGTRVIGVQAKSAKITRSGDSANSSVVRIIHECEAAIKHEFDLDTGRSKIDINNAGVIVGTSNNAGPINTDAYNQAFIYRNGTMTNLNLLVDIPGVILQDADGINDLGQIVAEGGDGHGYLLIPNNPVPEPPISTAVLVIMALASAVACRRLAILPG